MKCLFLAATYSGCRISSPDHRTIVVDGVRGQPLRIVFKQTVEHWQVAVSATAYFTDLPEPNHAPLCTRAEATPEVIAFWNDLAKRRFDSETAAFDQRVRDACGIIEGGPPAEGRRRKK